MIDYAKILKEKGIDDILPLNIVRFLKRKSNKSNNYELISDLIKIAPDLPKVIRKFSTLPYFGNDITFDNLYHICDIIGRDKIVNSLIANEIISTISDDYYKKFWTTAFVRTFFSLEIAMESNNKNIDNIFLSALLFDIGRLFIKKHFPIEHDSIYSLKRSEFDLMKLESQLLGTYSYKISAFIAKYCGFDKSVWMPIRLVKSKISSPEEFPFKQSVNILNSANKLCKIFTTLDSGITKYKEDISKILVDRKVKVENVLEKVPVRYNRFIKDAKYDLNEVKSYVSILENENRILSKINSRYEIILEELNSEKRKTKLLAEKMEHLNHKLLKIALRDPLTGAYNRRYLQEFLEVEFSRIKRSNSLLSIIATDIDYFKKINDTYGHTNGDIVLREIVKTFKKCIRATDIISRTGGEEFIIVCQVDSKKSGYQIAEKIRKTIEVTPIKLSSKKSINITMSFGVVLYSNEQDGNYKTLLDVADKKLYNAKEGGRNQVCI